MRLLIAASLGLILSACGEEPAPAPDAISAGEAKALDAAASMLDQRRLPPDAIPPEAAPPETAPPEATPAKITGDTAAPSGK